MQPRKIDACVAYGVWRMPCVVTPYAIRHTLLVGCVLLLLVLVQTAVAQPPVTDDQVNQVAKGLYCPICESTPLDVCPTQACIDWRTQIRGFLAQGQSEAEIHAYFAQRFGDGVLAEPPRRGANLILWLFPLVAIIGGGFFFSRYLRGLKGMATDNRVQPSETLSSVVRHPSPEKTILPPIQVPHPDYIARIEAELRGES